MLFDNQEYQVLCQVLHQLETACKSLECIDLGMHTPSKIFAQVQKLQNTNLATVTGCFEWMDGLLIKALEEGAWILMDNANLCNPSVLDRLNPLLEPNGYLLVNERGLVDGQVKIIKPHPNFRMFMTMDPKNGEISRPMV